MTSNEPHLSVVIPCYNEEKRLPNTLRDIFAYLVRQSWTSEVVVSDDGSTDGTAAVVKGWPDSPMPLRLVQHRDGRNHGKGATVQLGMLAARGRCRLFMDADNSTTCDHASYFLPYLDEGFDVVIGSRDIKGAVIPVRQSWYKMLAGDLGNLLIRTMVTPGICDTQAGFKLFSRRSAEDIFPRLTIDRWGFDVEILALAMRRGYRVKELPITWRNDPDSKVRLASYFGVLAEVWRVRRNLDRGLYDR